MKIFAPSYYKNFKCLADRCTHSCCIGWEIDVDADTLLRYEQLTGDLLVVFVKLLPKGINLERRNRAFAESSLFWLDLLKPALSASLLAVSFGVVVGKGRGFIKNVLAESNALPLLTCTHVVKVFKLKALEEYKVAKGFYTL